MYLRVRAVAMEIQGGEAAGGKAVAEGLLHGSVRETDRDIQSQMRGLAVHTRQESREPPCTLPASGDNRSVAAEGK